MIRIQNRILMVNAIQSVSLLMSAGLDGRPAIRIRLLDQHAMDVLYNSDIEAKDDFKQAQIDIEKALYLRNKRHNS